MAITTVQPVQFVISRQVNVSSVSAEQTVIVRRVRLHQFSCVNASDCQSSQDCPEGQLCLNNLCTVTSECEPSVDVIDVELSRLGASVGSVDTSDREDLYQASCGGGARSADQPIVLQIDTIGELTVTVVNAENFDTVLFLRSSCEVEGSQIACNDDANGLLSEIVTPILSAGTYYLFLDGFGNARGVAELELTYHLWQNVEMKMTVMGSLY